MYKRQVQDEPADRAGVGARPVGERLGAVAAAARDKAVFDAAVDLGLAGGTADWHAVRVIAGRLLRRAEGAGVR